MAAIDVFNTDAFSMFSLTASINKAPYQPKFLRDLGIFQTRPVDTVTVAVEDRQGTLALIPTQARGSGDNVRTDDPRTIRDFRVPHVPYYSRIGADDIQNTRAFGSMTALEAIGNKVNDRLLMMRRDHEATHEYHRIGAIQGQVLDADGSTVIYNYFTEFGETETDVPFNFTLSDPFKETVCAPVIRNMSDALGMTPYTKIIGVCGDQYFDELTQHSSVTTAYERWMNGEFLRSTQLGPEYAVGMQGFDFGNITFVNYRGSIDGVNFIPTGECRFIPVGVPDLFLEVVAPGDMVETVNTMGQSFYAKQEIESMGKGIKLHTQSNVLMLPTRPKALILSTGTFV